MQPLQICIGPIIRIGRESWCLPYAGFFSLSMKNKFVSLLFAVFLFYIHLYQKVLIYTRKYTSLLESTYWYQKVLIFCFYLNSNICIRKHQYFTKKVLIYIPESTNLQKKVTSWSLKYSSALGSTHPYQEDNICKKKKIYITSV